MSIDRETNRIVRSWLEDGVTSLPDRVLDEVLDRLPATSQRRPWWPAWRPLHMNTAAKLSLTAAAVVVVALLGLNILGGPNVGDGNDETDPSPSPTPVSLSALSQTTEGANRMAAGAYVVDDPFLVHLGFTVPDGWTGWVGGPYATFFERSDQRGWISMVIFDSVAIDPCRNAGFRDIGPEAADLATALSNIPGITVSDRRDVTVDGYRGTGLVITAQDSFSDCTLYNDEFTIWRLPLGAIQTLFPGESIRATILDVDGTRLVVVAPEPPAITEEGRAEIDAIVETLEIAPAD